MRSPDDRRIGFLLSLAALPLAACPSDDTDATASATDSTGADDDDDDSNSMSASMTEPDPDSSSSGPSAMTDPTGSTGPEPTESTGPEPTESSSGGSTDSGSTTGSSDESTTNAITVSESDTETDTDTAGTTGGELLCPEDIEIPNHCIDFGERYAECFARGMYADVYAFYCACDVSFYAEMDMSECAAAVEEFQVCIASYDCDTINSGECYEELVASDEACDFIELES